MSGEDAGPDPPPVLDQQAAEAANAYQTGHLR